MNNCLINIEDLVSFYRNSGSILSARKYSLYIRSMLITVASVFCLWGKAQLVVNEFSQGSGGLGFREYIELVVSQPRTCNVSTVDLRGWIVDDHNGWFGYMPSSRAAGCLRFANHANWANVPCGSIIVLYFHTDKNPKLPTTDDPTDSNGDGVYILPYRSIYLETNTTDPPDSGVPAANPYTVGTYTPGLNNFLSVVGLADQGDAIILANPTNLTTASYSILYGPGSASPTSVLPTVFMGVDVGAGQNAYLTDGQYASASSWSVGTVAGLNESPGTWNTAANQAWIQSLRTLPIISTTVNSPSICSNGGPATLTATPNLAGTYTYTWTVPVGVPNPGNVSAFTSSVAGNYSVNIFQGTCAATGSGSVIVNPVPAAFTGTNKTIVPGTPTTLGTSAIAGNSYSWTSVPAGFASSLSNPVVSPTVTSTYSLTETITTTGCKKTNSVVISMNGCPTIASQPRDTAVCMGEIVIFTAIISGGSSTATVQWQISPDGISGWNDINGAINSTLTFNAASNDDGKYYRAVFSDGCILYTNAARLLVGAPIGIKNPNGDPVSTTSCSTQPVTFTALANGQQSNLTVVWEVNCGSGWSDFTAGTVNTTFSGNDGGVITSNLTFIPNSTQSSCFFRAKFSNGSCPSQTTLPAALTILPSPTASLSISGGGPACSGSSVPVIFTGTPNAIVTYNIDGGPSLTITLSNSGIATINATSSSTYNIVAVQYPTSPSCPANVSGSVTVVIIPSPVVTTTNACIGESAVTFTQSNGAAGGTWSVSGGGTVNTASGVFTPNAAGCFSATYTIPGPVSCSNTKDFVVFPAAPTLAAPANTCNTAFVLPTVPTVPGFIVQYSIDGGAYSASPVIPTTTGCHTIVARYVTAAVCGTTAAGTAGSGLCGSSAPVNVVIFPAAPAIIAPSNTCNTIFALPTVSPVPGFTVHYSIDGGPFSSSPVIPSTPGCHTVSTRYVLTIACGSTAANDYGSCATSNLVNVVIFPAAPSLSAPANTCAAAFTLPSLVPLPGFTIQYNIDGNGFTATPVIPNTAGCHTLEARFVLTNTCGNTAANSSGSGSCTSSMVSVVIFPAAPIITPVANTCGAQLADITAVPAITGFVAEYAVQAPGGTLSAYNTNLNQVNNLLLITPGCWTIKARYKLLSSCGSTAADAISGITACQESTINAVVFPAPPTISAPSNTCNAPFGLPAVATVPGFNIQYSIDGGAFATSPSIPTSTGCHTIQARYILASDCGSTIAGASGTGSCAAGNTVSVVVFPTAPVLTAPANMCNAAFALPAVTAVPGFSVQYSIDGGSYSSSPTTTTPGCHTIVARYVTAAVCGTMAAGTAGAGSCAAGNSVSVVIFPAAPTLTTPANTCNGAFTLPTVAAIPGFTVQYSIDGGAYSSSPNTTATGCHTVQAQYVLTAACGSTAAGTAGTGSCAFSNVVPVVIFPLSPTITAPVNTCSSAFALPPVPAVNGFDVQYSIDGGLYATSASISSTPGCHTITARYVTASVCGTTAAGTAGNGSCGPGNTVNVVVFPAAPSLTALANTCDAKLADISAVPVVAGFIAEYAVQSPGGALSPYNNNLNLVNNLFSNTPGCWTIKARYKLASTCGTTPADAISIDPLCRETTINAVVFPAAPILVPPANTCNAAFTLPAVSVVPGFSIQYNIDGNGFSASPTIPTIPGCHTITARYILAADCGSTTANSAGSASCGTSNTVSVVIFPTTPVLTAPANTCSAAFTLPVVPAVAGFTIQFSIDGSAFTTSPAIPATPGCHTIAARYVLAAACGGTVINTAGTGFCGPAIPVNVVIFPAAPTVVAPSNTCNTSFTLPVVTTVPGFSVQYSIDGGAFAASPGTTTPGCHTVQARYVLTATCGGTAAGSAGPALCATGNTVSVVIFPAAPLLTPTSNTCASAFVLPTVSAVPEFDVEYSIDGAPFSASPNTTTPGCHTVQARYVLSATCGSTVVGTTGPGSCGTSNTISIVIFPTAPVITAPSNTCAAAFTLPTVTTVTGFSIQYSIDGAAFASAPTIPTITGCHTVQARYILTSVCGGTAAGTTGTGLCALSNPVSVVIFPTTAIAPVVSPGCGPFIVTPPAAITGFNIEYSFDNGVTWGPNTSPTADNCAGYKIKTRYVTNADCGGSPAGTASAIAACAASPSTTRIVDNTAPTWTTLAAALDVTLQCSDAAGLVAAQALAPAATDNCGSVTYIKTTGVLIGNFCGGTYTNTWVAKDACNNTSTTFSQVITINPPVLPTFTPPTNLTVACGAIPAVSVLAYSNGGSGTCLVSGSATSTQTSSPGPCGGTITETWSATDACGRTLAPVSRIITVSPAPIAVFAAAPPITVACGAALTSSLGYTNGASGICLISGTVTSTLSALPGPCGGNVTESWTFTDACNRTITQTRLITVSPAPLAVFATAPPITVACGAALSSSLGYTNGAGGTCLISGTVTSTLSALPGPCGGSVTESWTFTDACNRTITQTRLITVSPAPVAVFAAAPPITVACGAAVASDLTYTNNAAGTCLISGTVTSTLSALPGPCGGSVTESWTFTDACNRTITQTRVITVNPAAIAVFAAAPPITVACGAAVASDLTYTNSAGGTCLISGTVTSTLSALPGSCGGNVTESWTFTDACNRTITQTRVITVSPAPIAVFATVPPITVACGAALTSSLGYTNGASGTCLISGTATSTLSALPGACGGAVTETWTFIDACNRTVTQTRVITVSPAPIAVFATAPPITVACGAAVTSSLGYTNGASGTCLISGTVTSTLSALPGPCGGNVTESWSFTDACNRTITQTRVITVSPAPVAVFAAAPPITVACGAAVTSDLTYTNIAAGTCLISGTVTSTLSALPGPCGGNVTETWTFTDACNRTITQTRLITVSPAPIAVFAAAPPITVACGAVVTSSLAYTNSASGTCLISGTATSTLSALPGPCGGAVTETWTYADACNRTITQTRLITVSPAPVAVFAAAPPITVACGAVVTSSLGYTNSAGGTCLISGTVTSTLSVLPGACGGAVTETWTFTDACNRTITHTRVITVSPTPIAVFAVAPPITVACGAAVTSSLSYTNSATGTCLISGTATSTLSALPGPCGGAVIETWTFTDACNRTITQTRLITVSPAPVAVFAAAPPITVACGAIVTSSLGYTNSASGTCLISGTVTSTLSVLPGACGGAVTETWTFTDACNRTITQTRVITVSPAPVAVFANATPITVACGAAVTSSLTYTNSASGTCLISGAVTSTLSTLPGPCGGAVTETWTFTDACNRTITQTRLITVGPAPIAVFAAAPPITVACGAAVTSSLGYTNSASISCLISGTVTSTLSALPGPCGGPVTETWTFTDACNRTITKTRAITITPAPIAIFATAPPISVACGTAVTSSLGYTNGASGACLVSGTVTSSLSALPGPCGGLVTETWSFTDVCNRTIAQTRTITVAQAPAPTFSTAPGNITVVCSSIPAPSTLSYSNGASGSCLISGTTTSTQTATPGPNGGTITETWAVTDVCGRTITISRTITVLPQTTATFNSVASICSGEVLAPLPTTSLNGITGTWSPALNNTTSATYTFTPAAGQCATTTTLNITVNPVLSATINCGVSTTSSITFNWAAVSGATGYNVSYQVNSSPVVNVGAIGNVLTYQVTGLTGGDNVSITVTPTGGAGSCFSASGATCTATACTPPTASISYAGPFCGNTATPQSVTLTGTGSFTGGIYSALPGLTLNNTTGNITPATSTPGTYTITYTVAASGGCPGILATTSVTIGAVITPTFNAVTAICSGAVLAPLPTTSLNGISGTWSPALSNTTTTTYTFTPGAGQCATQATLSITVDPTVLPTFNPVASICSGAVLAPLPTTSLNGITGTWSPALSNTTTTTYTFTPGAGQCATQTTLSIAVSPAVLPTFNGVASICSGEVLAPLPTTSLNGITGTWSPALNNTTSATYTFTPAAGQCATTTTLNITVNPVLSATINCGVSTTSSITFNWAAVSGATGYNVSYQVNSSPVVNVGAIGNVLTYQVTGLTGGDNVSITVTPTGGAGSCFSASGATCTATACTPPTASISYAGPFCGNTATPQSVTLTGTGSFTGGIYSALPGLTLNSTTGNITPATSTPGTYTITYTVAASGGCPGILATTSVTIGAVITPTFNAVTAICSGEVLAPLPTTSLNGISGSWSPALSNTTTTTYTFTPGAGQCATQATLSITVDPTVLTTFNAVASICSGAVLAPLPTTSLNGITGTWSPALSNTATTTYTFTPGAGQCATQATLSITVDPAVLPTFNGAASICSGAVLAPLPTTSLNGITGTWSPALNNTTSATYTFTPAAGQCATTTTLNITVNPVLSATINCGVSTTSSITFNWAAVSGATGYNVSYQVNSSPVVNVGAIGNVLSYQVSGLTGGDNVSITVTPTGGAGSCFSASGATCTATACTPPTASISYAGPFCGNTATPQSVTLTGTGSFTGGVYSALPGLTLNSTTGNITPATSTPGTYTITYTVAANGGCPGVLATTSVTIGAVITPTFNAVTAICSGEVLAPLPTTSLNGISGSWSPALSNTTTTTYTFTPGAGQCATQATLSITVDPTVSPNFTQIGPLCQNSAAPALPLTSNNGINGTWNPSTINTSTTGTTTYTFTPAAGQCGANAMMDVVITTQITPTFTTIGPLCQNSTAPALPLTSNNGINGTWNPSTINTSTTGTTTYTFTPAAGQCGANATMDVVITTQITPTFTGIGPLCQNSTAPALPLTSNNGINGTWNPSTINTSTTGTTTYTFTPAAGQCGATATMDIMITTQITPTFTAIGPLCQNSTAPALPLTSNNGINGTWNPSTINTSTTGTTTYTFTPAAGQCGANATMDIMITTQITPTFTGIGPLCQNSTAPALPLTSNNGINGTWNPSTINTSTTGTTTYTFTPAAGQCGATATMDIMITTQITPTFTAIGPLCQNSTAPALPLTSNNGINGTWNPSTINTSTTGTTTYTFTPAAGQCGANATMDVVITTQITPTFTTIGPLCQNSTAPALPLTSNNGINGTWNPSTINTSTTGTTTYTFTPAAGQCGANATMDVVITTQITPTFTTIGPLCQNSTAPALPLTSNNGINGTWNPSTINTSTTGTTTYTFTPVAGQCGANATMDVVITTQITPTFTGIGPLCQNSTAPALPLTSNNGINGTWNPSTINTSTTGTTTYTFTPAAGQCGATATMDIMITTQITPTFTAIGPLCQNSTAPALPLTSNNGINGTWNPSTINTSTTGTTTYTFTPAAGQCGANATMDVVITTQITPTFTGIGPLCQNSTAPSLPLTSNNGINGTWNPSTINTSTTGTTTYTFTPAAGQCGANATMDVVITTQITPTFTGIGPLCQNSTAPALPLTSNNGINGTWNPSTINTSTTGTTTYTFTPAAGQCGANATMDVVITTQITPTFTGIGPLCQNSTAPSLPLTSNNGINGTWNPSTINTSTTGTTTYTFTPAAGQCGANATMDVVITTQIMPTFTGIGPLCQNSTAPSLPLTSNNGINGTWNPSTINTSTTGTTTYTFTPAAGQCGANATMDVVITTQIMPTFTGIGPLCQNSTAPSLPLTSNNGINGTWNPSTINTSTTGTTTYTFTPAPGQCGANATMAIVITTQITPTFTAIGPLCQSSTAPALPLTSNNGINGTWNSSTINTSTTGTTTYTFTPAAGQCGANATMDVVITTQITPTFTAMGPLCQNSTAPALPLTSNNGINGTWNPSTINTSTTGTTTYTFTPASGQCGANATMDVVITTQIIPTFTTIGPLCQNSPAPSLPLTSNNGINGTWSPSTINTSSTGTITYTFTPAAGQCGANATMDIVITTQIIPTFTAIGPLCQNSTAPSLPLTSNNGINGTWSPSTINTSTTGTTTYTFTPAAGQCGANATMNIVVTTQITPTFTTIGSLCQHSTAPSLPLTSNNGMSGTWNPSTINTSTTGTTTYTFTPAAGQCGANATMDIVVTTQITPTFTTIGSLCQHSTAPSLPLTSNNGMSGTWNPSTINTSTTGTTTYTFTPAAGQCGANATMDIVITTQITPTFTAIGLLCQHSTAPALPLTSNNGISGTWSPSTINTSATGPTTYTFTPAAGQCGANATMDIVIATQITPTFTTIGPLCQNSTAPSLPLTSNNNISGTWNPATINMSATGTYTFTPNGGQCAGTVSMDVVIANEDIPTFTQIGKLCLGSIAPALPTISNNNIPGTWNPSSISTASAGSFTYTFTPKPGLCAPVATLNITVQSPPALKITQPSEVCAPAKIDLTSAPITAGSSPGLVYSYWADAAFTTSITNANAITTSGTYYIKATSVGGCSFSQSVPVVVKVRPEIQSIRYPTLTTQRNVPVQLTARDPGGNVGYNWLPSVGLNSYTERTPVFSYNRSNEYIIKMTTAGGCQVVDTLLVKVDPLLPPGCNPDLFVPKAWSPNQDGHNDKLFPLVVCVKELKYFRIFDRWGKLMFETNVIGKGWDGIFRNKPQVMDVYTWSVLAVGQDGKNIKREGNTVLLR